MITRRTAILAILLLLPTACAQAPVEDFEDDTVLADPADSFYSYAKFAGGGTFDETYVFAPGLLGTDQGYQFRNFDGSGGAAAAFVFNGQPVVTRMDFAFFPLRQGTSSLFEQFEIQGDQGLLLRWHWNQNGAGNVMSITDKNGNVVLYTDTNYTQAREFKLSLLFDYGNSTVDYTISETDDTVLATGQRPFSVTGQTYMASVEWKRPFGNDARIRIDEWFLLFGEIEEEIIPQDPEEFDQGLQNLAITLGFISPQSQMYLTIILVALMTMGGAAALRLIGSGRFKNHIIHGGAALVGIFCVLLGWLELWMFVVGLIIGIFTIQAATLAANTYSFLREEGLRGVLDFLPFGRDSAEDDDGDDAPMVDGSEEAES